MPFFALPQEAKAPLAEVLPDGRKRLTRYFQVTTLGVVPPELNYAVKTADPWPAAQTPTGWTGLLLTYKRFEDQMAQRGADTRPIVELVFEQISSTGETQTGGVPLTQLPDGRKQAVYTYVMFSSSTYTPLVPGTASVTIGSDTYYLWDETNTNDGTLRNITRTYQTAGTVKTVNDTLFNGALLRRVITSFKTVPSTPTNYTAVGQATQNPSGYPIYDYTFVCAAAAAGAGGEISRDYYDSQGGTVAFNPALPNSATGAVRCVIRYLTDPSVTSNPITGPTSFVLVGLDKKSQEGYIEWTGTYGFGSGLVLDESNVSETGGLVVYHRVSLGSAPSTPSATIGGTVTLFDQSVRNADGYIIYDYRWAEGDGEVSRKYTNAQGGATTFNPELPGSATGSVLCTIVHFTDTSVTINPTSAPTVNFYLIDVQTELRNGYKVWTVRYAFGSGLVLDETLTQVKDALVVYHRVSFGSAPSTPSATIGGTVTLFETTQRNEDGFVVYDYRWAEGDGQASITTMGQPDGALDYNVVTYTAAASTPAYPGSGTAYLVRLTQEPKNAYFENTALYRKPPATVTFRKKVNFTKPGSATISGSPPQLVLNQQVTMTLLADVEVSYATSQITDTPFTVSSWATFYETYTPADTGITIANTSSLGGYLAGASGTSGTNSVYNGVSCTTWSYQLGSSTPSAFSTGSKVLDVDNDPYLLATDGTLVYRRTKVSYTFS